MSPSDSAADPLSSRPGHGGDAPAVRRRQLREHQARILIAAGLAQKAFAVSADRLLRAGLGVQPAESRPLVVPSTAGSTTIFFIGLQAEASRLRLVEAGRRTREDIRPHNPFSATDIALLGQLADELQQAGVPSAEIELGVW